MSDDNNKFKITAQFDQLEMLMINTAKIVASYYQELIDNGIPPTIAHHLTMQFGDYYWQKQFDIDTE